MLTYFLFIIGFGIIIKGADFLVDGASTLAKKLKISDLAIGLTIVAFGTSAPELIVNVISSIQGNTEIAIGNILGSNIANILLILGLSAVIFPLVVTRGTIWKEIPLSLLAAVLLGFMANDFLIDRVNFSALTRIDGLVFLSFFVIYMYYVFGIAKEGEVGLSAKAKEFGLIKSIFLIVGGLVLLFLGGKWVVDGAVKLALVFGVSQSLIGLTIVAVGTSLPELATSAIAAYKKNTDIAIGNIVGSNIFNIFLVLGVSSIIKPLPFAAKSNVDIAMVIFASLLLFFAMFIGRKRVLERWQGVLFIFAYISYVAFLIYQG
jgi:cation:H+ antiporter